MDLEEMKVAWKLVNENLAQQQATNSKLVRTIIREQSSGRFSRISRMEAINHIINWGLAIVLIIRCPLDNWLMKGSLGLYLLMISIFTLLSYQFMNKMRRVDIQRDTLVDTLKNIYDLKKYYYQYKKYGILTAGISIVPVILLVVRAFHGKNLFNHLALFGVPLLIGLVIGSVIAYYIYKNVYEKNLEEVELLIRDLEE